MFVPTILKLSKRQQKISFSAYKRDSTGLKLIEY
jgi:hypothetical protein